MERTLKQLTLVVSNAIKLGGLYLVIRAGSHPPVDPFELALSAFMMSGAQLTEDKVLKLLSSFMGSGGPAEKHKDEK